MDPKEELSLRLQETRLLWMEAILNAGWQVKRSPFERDRFSVVDNNGKQLTASTLTFNEAIRKGYEVSSKAVK